MTSADYPISRQIADAIGLLLLIVLISPPLFELAHWLRG